MDNNETLKKVDINSASAQQIADTCPMLGREKSEAIVRYRQAHGPYKSLEELRNIPGFAYKLSTGLRDFFTFGGQGGQQQQQAT